MFRRLLAAALVLLVAGALLVIAWPQLFGLQHASFIAQAVSLRGLAAGVALVCAIVLTLLAMLSRTARRFASSLVVLLLVFVGVSAVVLATRGFGTPDTGTPGGPGLTVLSWNTLGHATSPTEVSRLALEAGADIVALPETARQSADAVAALMEAAGHPMSVRTVAFDQIVNAHSTSLLISVDLGRYSIANGPSTSVLPTVVATPDDGAGPTIIAVHAVAPIPGQMNNWRRDLAWLATACAGDNVIMAGDFNATIDHMSRLGSKPDQTLGECTDAALQAHTAALGTWPTFLPARLGAPIDHIMATPRWRVAGMRVVEDRDQAGSDHRPIVVRLRPAG